MSDDRAATTGTARELPLFPLSAVLFPDGLLELRIFEVRYLDMMTKCMREKTPFGVVCLKSGDEAKRSDEALQLHDIGTLAELIDVDSAGTNLLNVRCRGTHRFVLGKTYQRSDGLWIGEASDVGDDPVVAPARSHAAIVKSLADAVESLAAQGAKPFLEPLRFDDAGWVANRWCDILPLPLEVKQRLMTLADPVERLDIVDSLMQTRQDTH